MMEASTLTAFKFYSLKEYSMLDAKGFVRIMRKMPSSHGRRCQTTRF